MVTSPGNRSQRQGDHAGLIGNLAGPLAGAMILLSVSDADAQQWEIEPFIQAIATYTDNVFLDQEGLEQTDYVGQLNPGISIAKDQGRFTTDLNYRMQSVFFASDSDLNAIYHQLNANGTLDVAAERLFIDADAMIDQSVVDPRVAIPTSNVVATQNLGDIFLANVNPYYVQPLGGSDVYLRLDYVWGIGRYDGFGVETFSNVDDFTQDRAGFYLGTDDQDTGFEWSATYDYQFVDYETVPNYKFERAAIGFGIPLARGFRFVALGGLESDLTVSTIAGGLDSDFWEVGFRYGSVQENVIEIRGGERFFGNTYYGNIQYSGQRFTTSVLYRENPTTSALDGLGAPVAPFSTSTADGAFEEAPPVDEIDVLPVRGEIYISKVLTARIEYATGKTLLFLSYSDEERDFGDDPDTLEGVQDRQASTTLGIDYDLGPRTQFGVAAAWTRYFYADTTTETTIATVILSLRREVGRETDLEISYRHALQDTTSASEFGNYTENAIDIGLVRRF